MQSNKTHSAKVIGELAHFQTDTGWHLSPTVGHLAYLLFGASLGAYLERHLSILAVIVAAAVAALLVFLSLLVNRLNRAVRALGGVLLRIDCLHVKSGRRGTDITEAAIYNRALNEIRQ